jgi:hypothetical protein
MILISIVVAGLVAWLIWAGDEITKIPKDKEDETDQV